MTAKTIHIRNSENLDYALDCVSQITADTLYPMIVVIKPFTSSRSLEQNSYYWACVDAAAEQIFIDGKTFSKDVWNEHFKREFLPAEESALTREGYTKWAVTPGGDKILVGSTTQLTTTGMTSYIQDVIGFLAEHSIFLRDL